MVHLGNLHLLHCYRGLSALANLAGCSLEICTYYTTQWELDILALVDRILTWSLFNDYENNGQSVKSATYVQKP